MTTQARSSRPVVVGKGYHCGNRATSPVGSVTGCSAINNELVVWAQGSGMPFRLGIFRQREKEREKWSLRMYSETFFYWMFAFRESESATCVTARHQRSNMQ